MARPTTTPAAEALQPYTVTRAMCMAGERVEVGATVHLTRVQGTELFAAGKVTPGAAEPAEAQAGETGAARPQFDASKIAFRIQLGALKAEMGVDAMDGLLELGDIEHRSTTGWHRYLHGRFASAEEARKALPMLQEAGFTDAFVVGDVAGRIIPLAEAEILLNQD